MDSTHKYPYVVYRDNGAADCDCIAWTVCNKVQYTVKDF